MQIPNRNKAFWKKFNQFHGHKQENNRGQLSQGFGMCVAYNQISPSDGFHTHFAYEVL